MMMVVMGGWALDAGEEDADAGAPEEDGIGAS